MKINGNLANPVDSGKILQNPTKSGKIQQNQQICQNRSTSGNTHQNPSWSLQLLN